jgi:hypothetical protein
MAVSRQGKRDASARPRLFVAEVLGNEGSALASSARPTTIV